MDLGKKLVRLSYKVASIQREINNPIIEVLLKYKPDTSCTIHYSHVHNYSLTLGIHLAPMIYDRFTILTLDPLVIVHNEFSDFLVKYYDYKNMYMFYWKTVNRMLGEQARRIVDYLYKAKMRETFIYSNVYTVEVKVNLGISYYVGEATITYYADKKKYNISVKAYEDSEETWLKRIYDFLHMYYDLLRKTKILAEMLGLTKLIDYKFIEIDGGEIY